MKMWKRKNLGGKRMCRKNRMNCFKNVNVGTNSTLSFIIDWMMASPQPLPRDSTRFFSNVCAIKMPHMLPNTHTHTYPRTKWRLMVATIAAAALHHHIKWHVTFISPYVVNVQLFLKIFCRNVIDLRNALTRITNSTYKLNACRATKAEDTHPHSYETKWVSEWVSGWIVSCGITISIAVVSAFILFFHFFFVWLGYVD